MVEPMPPVAAPEPRSEPAFELPVHARLPRLDLAVDWGSPWDEFRSSIHDFFRGAPAPKYEDLPADSDLRVDWVRDKFSVRSFIAACLWHVAAVGLLLLPIWGFLPKPDQTLPTPHIELTYIPPDADLPKISLPLPREKSKPASTDSKPVASRGADTFHPRQTILSEPVRVTHPRQTLIQPAAPMTPPKIDVPLPNIVQWSDSPAPPKPRLHFTPSVSAPQMRHRIVRNLDAPEIPNSPQTSGELNIAPAPVINPAPRLALAPMAAAKASERRAEKNLAAPAAPEISADASSNSDLPSIVALSASPAPPAPVVEVPRGNLAARISASPEGGHSGSPGGNPSAPPSRGNSSGHGAEGNSDIGGGGGRNANLPAAVSISGASGHGTGGGIAPSHSGLILRPMGGIAERPEPATPKGPADIAHLNPSMAPETLLSGKQIYTLHVDLPNFTSISGSWIIHFAQLDENQPIYRSQPPLAVPEPILKVDPEYPPDAIKKHIDGEVVLYAIIRKDGTVSDIQFVRRVDPEVDSKAAEAFAKWKFRPGSRSGVPVEIEAIVHIPFFYRKPDE